jgi:hypothetical protein
MSEDLEVWLDADFIEHIRVGTLHTTEAPCDSPTNPRGSSIR